LTTIADANGDVTLDWAGMAHAPAGSTPRIACLVPSLTELLFALGLGEHVVARTGFCIHPRPAIKRVPKIGGTKDPDLDRLRVLAPTHLIVNVDENRREVVDAARAFVPHVIVTHPAEPADNARLYALLGAIFDRVAQASSLTIDLKQALAEAHRVGDSRARERVLYLIWRKPWMTVARSTYVGSTLAAVGWDCVEVPREARYPVIEDDDAAWSEAQRVLLSTEPYAFRARDAVAIGQQRGRPAMLIDGEWTSWYGVRAIAGLRALADLRRNQAG
jgi:ABC-type Fe3+-hydroxamate transport system substrate-binding protein